MELTVQVPRALKPLLPHARYKGAYGGRGGAKSHFFAEHALVRCVSQRTRIVCIREVQNSIRDSVRQLLVDKIAALGLESSFNCLEAEIRGPHGSLIIFRGMQSYNAANIKSLEAYDVAWVEEAQTLSQHSLDMLRPTIRKAGSEMWFSWNPTNKTDAVDKLFRGKNPPDGAISVPVHWRDNPWFPSDLRSDMQRDFAEDEDKAEHVWNGAYGAAEGSILGKWVNRAEREGRIKAVSIDPDGPPLDVSSDIGFRDTAGWWYWQRKHLGFSILKYEGDSGMDADDWIPKIKDSITELGGKIGKIWLPHDARVKTFQSKHSSVEKFLKAFGEQHVGIVPQSKKSDQINAARAVIGRCEFDREMCDEGLDGLRAWQFELNPDTQAFSREPLHDWSSHPSDAFAYGCQVMEEVAKPKEAAPPRSIAVAPHGVTTATMNDLWQIHERKLNRKARV